jgi:TonB family protein
MGVMNGYATSLPKPNYPAAAKAVNIQGKVDVQILIDETGKVVSAKAVSGNPLLRSAAVTAAWNARFTPTRLSNVPVKVTGVIIYNFSRS